MADDGNIDQDENPTDANDGGNSQENGASGSTFTQEQMNTLAGKTRIEERAKFADYTELQEKAARLDKIEEANKTELERANSRAETFERERDTAISMAKESAIRSAFIAEAARAGVLNPDDAYALADKAGIALSDDGSVVGVSEAVNALVESGRLPMQTGKPAPGLDGGSGDGGRGTQPVKLTREQENLADSAQMTHEEYAENMQKMSPVTLDE